MAQSIPFGSRSTADQVLAGVDLSRNRVVVVTGCNSSIGFETMKALHANGARVIGLARTLDEAAAACNAVGRSLTPLSCDPMDPLSVDAAVESIRSLSSPLDAVVVNSFDLRCFADHIAQFVLVNRLAELVQYGTGRIVIGSKHANITDAPLENVMLETLGAERIYDVSAFHGQAKLATALFARELSRRLEARGVAVNVFFSGAAKTWQSREARPAAQRLIQAFLRYFTKSPAQWAATPALLAASPLVMGMTGGYWSNCQMSRGNPLFSDLDLAKQLWDLTVRVATSAAGRGHLRMPSPMRHS